MASLCWQSASPFSPRKFCSRKCANQFYKKLKPKKVKEKNADAQCLLGDMYLEGMGVTENYAEAIRLWKLAAEQGDEEAQYNLNNYA